MLRPSAIKVDVICVYRIMLVFDNGEAGYPLLFYIT